MLRFYIIVSIVLFLVVVYLVIVLINFKRRKRNAWLWFIEKDDNDEDNLIPIKYDINDSKNEKNNKNYSTVFLSDSDTNNDNEIKNSKYSKINA